VNKALEVIKKHWIPVAMGGAALVLVPAAFYFSHDMNSSFRERIQKEVDADSKELSGQRITYRVDPIRPSDKPIEYSGAPNQTLIDHFKKLREEQAASSRTVLDDVLKFNKGVRAAPTPEEFKKRAFLVQGVFPQPADQGFVELSEFPRKFAVESVPALLATIRAGEPADPAKLGADLELKRKQELEAAIPPGGTVEAIPAEQVTRILDGMLAMRIGRYQEQAQRINIYASPSAFVLPQIDVNQRATLDRAWDWQQMHWIHEDVIAFIARANGITPGQPPKGVASVPIKRLNTVQVWELLPAAAPTDPTALPVFNPFTSVTGRSSGPLSGNGLYDIRRVNVEMIVRTSEIPAILNAVGQTNFMSVLDFDVRAVDVMKDLGEGFYYGPEHVSALSLTIETVWLREWTKPFMPASVRTALGIPPDAPADPAAAPAPAAGGTPPG
jgi:hypothetical protein